MQELDLFILKFYGRYLTYNVPLGISMRVRFCPLNIVSVVGSLFTVMVDGTGMTLTSGRGEAELLVGVSRGCK